MDHLNHLHLIVTAYIDTPPKSAAEGEAWLVELVRLIDMQILMNAKAVYCEDLGNEGVTGIVGMTTSHASFHEWSYGVDRPFFNADVYSCTEFDREVVFEHIRKHFGLNEVSYLMIDRNDGKNEIIANGREKY